MGHEASMPGQLLCLLNVNLVFSHLNSHGGGREGEMQKRNSQRLDCYVDCYEGYSL